MGPRGVGRRLGRARIIGVTRGRRRQGSVAGAAFTRRTTGVLAAEADDAVAGRVLRQPIAILAHRPAEQCAEAQAIDVVVGDHDRAARRGPPRATPRPDRGRRRRARSDVLPALALGAARRERIRLPGRAQLGIARAALVGGEPVPRAVVDLEQAGVRPRSRRRRRSSAPTTAAAVWRQRSAGLLTAAASRRAGSSASSAREGLAEPSASEARPSAASGGSLRWPRLRPAADAAVIECRTRMRRAHRCRRV